MVPDHRDRNSDGISVKVRRSADTSARWNLNASPCWLLALDLRGPIF